MRKYLSTLLVASALIASCSKEAEVIREKIVSQSRPILSGQGQPDNGKGEDGDYYLDLTNAKLYGPKTQGAWGEPSLDLKGLPGKDGKDGKDGQNGQDGQPGRDGQNGTNGESPRIGENGNWWVGNTDLGVKAQGAPGQKGQDGQPGRDGQNGTTPRIGDNGNWWIGNEDTGKPARGTQGQKGEGGQPGRDGQNGAAPRIGDNGNWWVGNEDTGKPARGAQGERGIPGQNGRDGNNGFTPYIGPNGNWWVDNYDTHKPARGEQGRDGAAGQNGQNGVDGSKILAEDRAPQATDGVKGDYFIDKAAKIFYGPKTDAGWPTTGIYLGTNQILSADYQLSEDGKTLVKWINPKTRFIDMNADPKLKLVERIEENAFNTEIHNITYQLTTIIIGDRVREIGQYAFNLCKRLKEVEIPEGVTQINSGTFANCHNLNSVQLPESLTKVGNGSFANNFRLSTIILPKNVNEIGNNAFNNCPNLHSIILENRTAFPIKKIQFGMTNETLQNIFVPRGTKTAYEALITGPINIPYKAKLKEVGI